METRVGGRFLLPVASSLSSTYLEVRRVGNYPTDMIFAFLYQYLERALEENDSSLKTRFLTLIRSFLDTDPEISSLYHAIEVSMDSSILRQREFVTGLETVTQRVMMERSLSIRNDYNVVQAFIALSVQLHCRGFVYFLIPNSAFEVRRKVNFGDSGPEIVTIGSSLEVYLLYDYLAKDSFFMGTCNCVSLKYHIFADIQEKTKSTARSIPDLCALNIQCRRCTNPFPSEDITRLLSNPQVSFTLQTREKECGHMGDNQWGLACMMCQLLMCGVCCIVRSLTAIGPVCPGCQTPCIEQARQTSVTNNYPWVNAVLDIVTLHRHFEYNQQKLKLEEMLTEKSRTIKNSRSKEDKIPIQVTSVATPGFKQCRDCKRPVIYSLCSRGCCCTVCAIPKMYASVEPQRNCLYCRESIASFLSAESRCARCKKDREHGDMAVICGRCDYKLCELCFLAVNGKTSTCPVSSCKHADNVDAKLKRLIQKLSRDGSLPAIMQDP